MNDFCFNILETTPVITRFMIKKYLSCEVKTNKKNVKDRSKPVKKSGKNRFKKKK